MTVNVENPAIPVLVTALRRILAPLVKILLRHGITFQAFTEEAKKVFVEVAEQEFPVAGRKQSAARVAIITGISRKEISRMHQAEADQAEAVLETHHRAARVISAWVNDPGFQDDQGRPLELPVDDATPSFAELVRKSSGDMLVRAMLDELTRVGAVEVKDKTVRLVNRSYIPAGSDREKLRILGTDVGNLIATINHNLVGGDIGPLFQRKVYYDNLPREALPELRTMTRRHGQELIELLDKSMQVHDRDVNPEVQGDGHFTAGIGVYYFEHESTEGAT